MPRYKVIDTNPQFLAIDLAKQLLPGSFEYAVHYLVTRELDLSAFDARIQNDETGATAYPPEMLLEVVLCVYAQGDHSEANLATLADRAIDALIADGQLRKRDERFATQATHRTAPDPLHDKGRRRAQSACLPRATSRMTRPRGRVCAPPGQSLYRKGTGLVTKGHIADHFRGAKGVCGPCPLRAQCVRTPEKTVARQVAFFTGKTPERLDSYTARMQRRIDAPAERARYARRFATVDPVFGNLCANKGLARFTLRGRANVDAQWKLFCLVHNIEKLAHHGYGVRAA